MLVATFHRSKGPKEQNGLSTEKKKKRDSNRAKLLSGFMGAFLSLSENSLPQEVLHFSREVMGGGSETDPPAALSDSPASSLGSGGGTESATHFRQGLSARQPWKLSKSQPKGFLCLVLQDKYPARKISSNSGSSRLSTGKQVSVLLYSPSFEILLGRYPGDKDVG